MDEKIRKFDKRKMIMIYMAGICLLLGISYALLEISITGQRKYSLRIGGLVLKLDESKTSRDIIIQNAAPVKDEVGMKNASYNFSLVNEDSVDIDYTIYIVEDYYENKTPSSAIRYFYSRDIDNINITRNLQEQQTEDGKFYLETGTISAGVSYNYEFKMWLNYEAGEEIQETEYSVHLEIAAIQTASSSGDPVIPKPDTDIEKLVATKVFSSDKVGENCRTYNDGMDLYLVGQCQNNYIWYSGKLWRVVSKNNKTGSIKMVTDNDITFIPYNSNNNINFEGSYIDQWLNQEFLPTLHDYQDYLVVDSIWDTTMDATSSPVIPTATTTVKRAVGILNAYEYYTTYNKSSGLATYANTYLNNGMYSWTLTPSSTTYMRYTYSNGMNTTGTTTSYGVRPVINLQSTIQVDVGTGTLTDPYILTGDKQETINGVTLLSTRYSGEYIKLNNELYRIVLIENGQVKVTAVNRPTDLTTNAFHSSNGIINFEVADIKGDLANYYYNMDELTKNLIEENSKWYLGTVGAGVNYKASICRNVDSEINTTSCEKISTVATSAIGLPRLGEMFTSQITRETKASFWTLTPYSTSYVRSINIANSTDNTYATSKIGARPSLYLKSNVRISSTNEGNGTYDYPYEIG